MPPAAKRSAQPRGAIEAGTDTGSDIVGPAGRRGRRSGGEGGRAHGGPLAVAQGSEPGRGPQTKSRLRRARGGAEDGGRSAAEQEAGRGWRSRATRSPRRAHKRSVSRGGRGPRRHTRRSVREDHAEGGGFCGRQRSAKGHGRAKGARGEAAWQNGSIGAGRDAAETGVGRQRGQCGRGGCPQDGGGSGDQPLSGGDEQRDRGRLQTARGSRRAR